MKDLTKSLEGEAKEVGLNINVTKTKVMTIGTWSTTEKIKVDIEDLDECEKFCYLGIAPSVRATVVKGK
jgi:hypothetical protein